MCTGPKWFLSAGEIDVTAVEITLPSRYAPNCHDNNTRNLTNSHFTEQSVQKSILYFPLDNISYFYSHHTITLGESLENAIIAEYK